MAPEFEDHPFWDYSIDVYSTDGVPAACLVLQEKYGIDALRAVRERLKGGLPPAPETLSDALRRRILKIEVDCEHTEQLMLAGTLERKPDGALPPERRAADALANIANYFSRRNIAADGEDAEQLAIILGPALTELESGQVASLCRGLISSAST
jgi:hypothetical protein